MAQNQRFSCMFHWSPWERGKEETKNIWRHNDQIFPNLIKTIKPQIQGAQQITNSKNTKEAKPKLSIFTISIQDWTSSSAQYNNARHRNKMHLDWKEEAKLSKLTKLSMQQIQWNLQKSY